MMKCFPYVLIVIVVCCDAKCSPSSCGILSNISSPFRLKGDPKSCGDRRFELRCKNNVAYISSNSNYYVKAIDHKNSTIRLVDASIVNDNICSFPVVSPNAFSIFNSHDPFPYRVSPTINPINFFSCPNPLKNSSLFTDVTTHCASSSSPHLRNTNMYAYIKVGHMNASELPQLCTLDLVVMTSWPEFKDLNNVSLSEIHQSLLYGFELVFCSECSMRKTTQVVITLSIDFFCFYIC